jgi:hypothetical protein
MDLAQSLKSLSDCRPLNAFCLATADGIDRVYLITFAISS